MKYELAPAEGRQTEVRKPPPGKEIERAFFVVESPGGSIAVL